MSIDKFWKRVPEESIAGRGPAELEALVPTWFDDRFTIEQGQRIVVGVEDTSDLINALVRIASSPLGSPAAHVFSTLPPDWDDNWMVGTMRPADVGMVAQLLTDAPLSDWVAQHHAALAQEARRLGYRRPFDEDWASLVLSDAEEVTALFRTAANENEAVIIKILA